MFRTQHHTRCLALAGMAALAALLATPAADAAEGRRDLVVMTQNLYQGSSLAPVLEATTEDEFLEAVNHVYATVQYTNFPVRAAAIADEIQAKRPDIIGLPGGQQVDNLRAKPAPGIRLPGYLAG